MWLPFGKSDADSLPYWLQLLAGCPHLKQIHQANLCTYHLPTQPFVVHAN